MNKTAIVIGATGLIGKHLVSELCHDEIYTKVICLTRRPLAFTHSKIINHVIDFEKLDEFSELIKGDILFSCLGTTLKQSGSIEAQRKVDLDYQLQCAKIAHSNNVPHYFLVSSSGANANSRSAYLKMKGELEIEIKRLHFPTTYIFQPSLLIGKRPEKRIAESIGTVLLPIICKIPGLQKYNPIQGKLVALKMHQESVAPKSGVHLFTLSEVFPCL